MDPRTVIANIMKSRKLMEKQLARLDDFSPTLLQDLSGHQTISDIMNAAVSAQFQDAVNALSTLSGDESTNLFSGRRVKHDLPVDHPTPDEANEEQPIIDIEIKE